MKKFIENLIEALKRFAAPSVTAGAAAAIMLMAAPAAHAQRGFDEFNVPRTVVLAPPVLILASATTPITNSPIDTRAMAGLAKIDIFCNAFNTNTTAGSVVLQTTATGTLTLQTSSDTTNYSNIGSVALINSQTSVIVTNSANTNITATVKFLLPGTYTTPVAALTGLAAVQYLVPLQYTNTGAISIVTTNITELGINIEDVPNRYLRTIFTPTAGFTNMIFGPVILTTPIPTGSQWP